MTIEESCFVAFMPGVTYDGSTKNGIILYYIAEDHELYLVYVSSQTPESYTVYKAADQYGNVEPAWTVTDLGWTQLSNAINLKVEEYAVGNVTYQGAAGQGRVENFTVAFDPD